MEGWLGQFALTLPEVTLAGQQALPQEWNKRPFEDIPFLELSSFFDQYLMDEIGVCELEDLHRPHLGIGGWPERFGGHESIFEAIEFLG